MHAADNCSLIRSWLHPEQSEPAEGPSVPAEAAGSDWLNGADGAERLQVTTVQLLPWQQPFNDLKFLLRNGQ